MSLDGKRVAIATKDGLSINTHFGHAKDFWIYEYCADPLRSNPTFLLKEQRNVDNYCKGHDGYAEENGHDSQSVLQKIILTLNDCSAVFVAKIGDSPKQKLSKAGIEAVEEFAYDSVVTALESYAG